MSKTVISVENLTKRYQLGVISTGTLTRDLNKWWARARGKPDPYAKIGETDYGNHSGDSILALKDVSFTVRQGEALGIIGNNGAGKSTLLKILSQVTAPTSGVVKVKGRIGSLLEVGTGFHGELTGRENIYLNGAILGMTRAEVDRKFDEIIDFSGIEQFIDTPVKRYSSGMYVRLAFAVAAHLDPEILIVDEVLAVGDAEFRKKCLGKMGDVTGEGRTVLFVSHNMGAIESLCPKSILLSSGKIISEGKTNKIVNLYLASSENNKDIPLLQRKDRRGSGKLVFEDIKVDINKVKQRKLQIFITIKNQSHQTFDDVILSIVIDDFLGKPLTNMVNAIIDKRIPVGLEGVKVRLSIDNLNLVPGTYSINPFFSSDIHNGEIYDWIRNAALFIVPDYDYYQTGQPPYIKGQSIYLDYDYQII